MPNSTSSNGFVSSIHDPASPVKTKYIAQTDTEQFRRWFKGSKVVDEAGNAKVMYYGMVDAARENGDQFIVVPEEKLPEE